MYASRTHTYPYCKLSPVCLPGYLLRSLCLYLCLTLIFHSMIITYSYIAFFLKNNICILPPHLAPYSLLCFPYSSLFPAVTAVISLEQEAFDQPELKSLLSYWFYCVLLFTSPHRAEGLFITFHLYFSAPFI